MTESPVIPMGTGLALYYWETFEVFSGDDDRTVENIGSVHAASAAHALIEVCEDTAARDALSWSVAVRRDLDGPVLYRMDHRQWRALPPGLTLDEKAAYGAVSAPGDQPAPVGAQGPQGTGNTGHTDAHLDAKLRKLFGELLGVDVNWSGTVDLDKVDPDLLKTLKVAYNPKNELATRLANAHNRLMAFSEYLQRAGGVFVLLEVRANREIMLDCLREYTEAVEAYAK